MGLDGVCGGLPLPEDPSGPGGVDVGVAVAIRRTGSAEVALAAAGAGAGAAGFGLMRAGIGIRRITTGAGVATGRGSGTGAGRMTTTGGAATPTWACGSPAARTIEGWDGAGSTANDGVCGASDPAKKRGNAAAPATAPASNKPTNTPLVIALMLPALDADGITRTRYRLLGTRA